MNTDHIIQELEAERDRLAAAIVALQASDKARGNRSRVMSDSARRKQSLAARRRWREAKKAGKSHL